MVFDAARAAGWVAAGQRLDHVGFGVRTHPEPYFPRLAHDTVRRPYY